MELGRKLLEYGYVLFEYSEVVLEEERLQTRLLRVW